jgi:hypothetical protein
VRGASPFSRLHSLILETGTQHRGTPATPIPFLSHKPGRELGRAVPSAPAGSDLGLPGTGRLSLVSSLAFYCSPCSAQLAYGLQTLLPSVETKSILQCLG